VTDRIKVALEKHDLVTAAVASFGASGLSYGTLLAFGALIGMPIIFAVIGLMVGIFEVLVFNICSKWMDFLVINFEQER